MSEQSPAASTFPVEDGAAPAMVMPAALPETGRLPLPPNLLIGRDDEVLDVRRLLLQPSTRMVTVTGTGGTGKTRLALDVAHGLAADFPDAIWFVDLSSLSDDSQVMPVIARALGMVDAGLSDVSGAIVRSLQGGPGLLVLDNFERVLSAAPEIGRLLEALPELSVLVTSREPLRLSWEHEYPLQPLRTPEEALPLAELLENPAIELLLQRAQAVLPRFELSASNAASIAEIVRRLDGLPLAIELAAARMRVLPPAELLTHLEHRLDVLRGGPRDAPMRHQTLREAIAWSHELLDARERAVLRRMAVFAGGCTLEAARAVCASEEVPAAEVLDSLEELAAKSLVTVTWDHEGRARYGMLQTLREFALEQLEQSGEAIPFGRRQRDWCVALAERSGAAFWTSQLTEVMDELEREIANLWAALEWTIAHRDGVEEAMNAVGYVWLFWDVRGFIREASGYIHELVGLPEAAGPTPGRARALLTAGWLATLQNRHDEASELCTQSDAIWATLDDIAWQGQALVLHGLVEVRRTNPAGARPLFEQALEIAEISKDPLTTSGAYAGIGFLNWITGRLDEVEEPLNEGLAFAYRDDIPWGIAWSEFALGVLALIRGDLEDARTRLETALRLRWEMRDRRGLLDGLQACAWFNIATGDSERAAQLLGATESLREVTGTGLQAWLQPLEDRMAAAARERIGSEEFDRARAEGARLQSGEAVALALGTVAPTEEGEPAAAGTDATSASASPADAAVARHRVLATVLFTDIVQSTERAVALGDERWTHLLDSHDRIARNAIQRVNGRWIKSTGDGVLGLFDEPRRAIAAAAAMRREVAPLGITIRAGIHTGEVELRDDDVGGIGVHIAARIGAAANDGEILVSSTVVSLVLGSELSFEDRGEVQLKGVPGVWRVAAVTDA